ncbi:hypothetical protein KIPB_001356 [Kipferlia bialata]|uniref:Uncharacterized protein n=1 Tax=Kipferlia bialata TaxID=797122 RepID=A0A9K3CQH8_9EUKA|nr:hypothetical protein KIPB_001356 [Kipferlia bialata]|eukprot:g1356.t1
MVHKTEMTRQSLPDPVLCVGLDIGTSFSGYAMAHILEPNAVDVSYEWTVCLVSLFLLLEACIAALCCESRVTTELHYPSPACI